MTEWLVVENTPTDAHKSEAEEQWLDRVLELPPGVKRSFRVEKDGTVSARGEDGAVVHRVLAASRVNVLRSMIAKERSDDWRKSDGAGWVLCDASASEFLLTRKDDRHPNARCRGRLACMSGGVEEGETHLQGALRELYEELRDARFADEVAERAKALEVLTLSAVQWSGSYRMGAWVAAVESERFRAWKRAWQREGALSEASAIVMERAELQRAIERERAESGSQFVASHHELFTRVIEQVR